MRPLALALLVLGGCSSPAVPTDFHTALGEAAQRDAPVFVLDSGASFGAYLYHGAHYDNIWVDLSVRNDAWDKQVGIVWTNDHWSTSHTAAATYEGALGARERWGVDVQNAVAQVGWQTPGQVEYAAFVTMNGVTSWSPYRDHVIYDPVSPAQPLRLLSSGAGLGDDGRAIVNGVVRALNVSGRRVFVRYSVDGWASWGEAEAQLVGTDFAFHVTIDGDPARIEEVVFALRLEAGGEAAWDNHGGANYAVRLAPRLADARYANAPSRPVGGIALLVVQAETALPVTAVTLRFDDGTVRSLPAVSSGQLDAVVYTPSLSRGPHTVSIELAAGPYVRRFDGPTLDVDDQIRPLGGARVGNGEVPWSFARTAAGELIVLTEQRLLRYPSLTAQPVAFDASPVNLSVGDLAVDGLGHVYALGNQTLVRWEESGALDPTFGTAGALSVSGTYDGVALCWAADLAADANAVYVIDSCNARVLRFSHAGVFLDALALDSTAYPTIAALHGGKLWLSRASDHTELLEVGIDPAAPMTLLASHPSDVAIDSFAVTSDGFWVTSGSDLIKLDAAGHVTAWWLGGGRDTIDPPGSLALAKHVGVEADGTIDVLSVDGAHLEQFQLQ